ncbi:MAG: RNA-dependent RNA polymerase [Bat faecal associated chuvirus 3]|nr:MAG: RNA-dependent RNA polymerase [Bat faecal associated chuvirus 3]
MAFMQEEKFDTWLDLGNIIELSKLCVNQKIWTTSHFKSVNHIISPDSIAMMYHMGIEPSIVEYGCITPLLPAKLVHYILSTTITRCHMAVGKFTEHLAKIREAALYNFLLQQNHLFSSCDSVLIDQLMRGSDVWIDKIKTWPKELYSCACVLEDMMYLLSINKCIHEYDKGRTPNTRAKSKLQKLNKIFNLKDGKCALLSIKATVQVTHDVTIMSWQNVSYILNHNLLLEVINKCAELYCTVLYSYMINGTCQPDNHYDVMIAFLSHISDVVKQYCTYKSYKVNLHHENKGFTYLKIMEGLGVAEIIRREDGNKGWANEDLQKHLWKSVYEENLTQYSEFDRSTIGHIFAIASTSTISEMIGCVKVCGHPSIEVERGLQKLYDRTHENIDVSTDHINRAIAINKRDMILNYHNKYNRYPELKCVDQLPMGALRDLLIHHIPPNSPHGISLRSCIKLEQWYEVKLGKNAEFDPINNELALLKDKALGVVRSKVLLNLVLQNTDDCTNKKTVVGELSERRVLLRFLLNPYLSNEFTQFVQSYSQDDPWPDTILEHLVFKLTPKELEEKQEGRMFGASPLFWRNQRVIQENNVMDMMDDIVPDQTMTPNELTMMKKLYAFRIFNKVYPGHTLLQVSFDFSKWNNSMRHESIDIPAKELLDPWFDKPIFSKTMKAYHNTLFYYSDGIRTKSWEGQLGGIDGMNQFTWSFIFLGGIKQALEQLGVLYQVNVKGDDVRAVIAIPSSGLKNVNQIEEIKNRILAQLQNLCGAMGWKLNPHECFVSLSLIATSKQYQVNDCWLSASTKKMAKALSLSNLLYPTLEDIVGNIFSICHSACSQGTSVIAPFITALICAAGEIDRDYFGRQALSSEELSMMLLWPQCLGGPGPLPLQTYIIRGENDMLSVTLSLMRYILIYGPSCFKDIISNILCQQITTNPDYTLLLGNPYSIPLDVPERPMAILKRLMREQLQLVARHPDRRELLSVEGNTDRQEFINVLSSCTPYLAKPVTVLWECSPFYIIDEIISRFTSSSTVFHFLSYNKHHGVNKTKAHRALKNIMNAAKQRHDYWLRIIRNLYPYDVMPLGIPRSTWLSTDKCTAEISSLIRNRAWNRNIYGITYPSLVEQTKLWSPSQLSVLAPHWDISNIGTPILIYKSDIVFQTTDKSDHYAAIPNNPPWLGQTTANKSLITRMDSESRSPVLNKLSKLLSFYINCDLLGKDFKVLSQKLIKSLTGIQFSKLEVLVPETGGGSIAHRAAINAYNMTTMPNYRSNLTQLVQIPKDSGGALRGDMVNRTVNFAARFYHNVFLATYPLQSMTNLPVDHPEHIIMVFHNDIRYPNIYKVCPYCCANIDDIPISIKGSSHLFLDRYRYLPLVGCSIYENKILEMKIDKVTKDKRRRTELSQIQEISHHEADLLASYTTFASYISSQMHIYDVAQGSNFTRIPGGELANILMVGMSKRSLETVSMNAIRALSPTQLYNCVFSLYIDIMIKHLSFLDDTSELTKSYFIMAFKNPLSNILRELALAGLLSSIKVGADQVGYVHNFEWGAGSFTQLGIAAEQFNAQHVHLIKQWIDNGHALPRITLFCHGEDEYTIGNKMNEYVRSYKLIMVRSIVKMVKGCNFKQDTVALLAYLNFLDHASVDYQQYGREMHIRQDKSLPSLQDAYDDSVYLLESLCEKHMNNIAGVAPLRGLLIFFACLIIDISYKHGDWIDDDCTEVTVGSTYHVLLNKRDEISISDLEFPNRLEENDNLPITNWLANEMGEPVVKSLHQLLLSDTDIMQYDKVQVFIDGLIDEAEKRLNPINKRTIGVMRLDDALNIIKKSNVSLIKSVDQIRNEYHHRYTHQENTMNMDLLSSCHIYGGTECHLYALFNQPMWEQTPIMPCYSLPEKTNAITTHDDIVMNNMFWDNTELYRFGGGNNTSVNKYVEIIDLLGLHDLLSDENHPSLVVCLADGLGGVSAHMLRAYSEIRVLYNSLQTDNLHMVNDSSQSDMPIEVLNCHYKYKVHHRIYYRGMYPGDLTRIDMPHIIVNYADSINLPVSLITCDADINFEDDLESAYKIWVNALQISYRLSNDNTYTIMKVFAIDHHVVKYIMYLAVILFGHVHYYRSTYSRTRSTEVFIICNKKREKIMDDDKWVKVFRRSIFPIINITVATYIAEFLNNVSKMYMNSRLYGDSKIANLLELYKAMWKMRVKPLSASLWLSYLGISTKFQSFSITKFGEHVYNQLNIHYDDVVSLYRAMLPNKKRSTRITLRGKGQTVLAFGSKLPYILVRKIIRLLVTRYIILRHTEFPDSIKIIDYVQLLDYITEHLHDLQIGWDDIWNLHYQDGYLWFISREFYDNLSMLLHMTIRKTYQIISAWYYTACSTYLDKIGQGNYISEFVQGLQLEHHDYPRITTMFTNRDKWLVPKISQSLRQPLYTNNDDPVDILKVVPYNYTTTIVVDKCPITPIYLHSIVQNYDSQAIEENIEEVAIIVHTSKPRCDHFDDIM